jgi:hypothetical protein
MQPKFLVLEVQKITNFLELTFFLDLAGCALPHHQLSSRFELARNARAFTSARSFGFSAIWVCISSSGSSSI